MKRIISNFHFLLNTSALIGAVCVFQPVFSQTNTNLTLEETLNLGLPVVVVETINQEEPTCDYVTPPPGAWGAGITNATKVPGRVQVIKKAEGIVFDSGEYEKGESGMTIKIRGNTSAYDDKKPYKIKLQVKKDMLHRSAEDGKDYRDKDWLLIKETHLNTLIGFKVNQIMGLQWTPSFEYVNLIFNNDYRGVYMLCEAVGRNKDCRLNVDKDSGYIAEVDSYWWNEDVYFKSNAGKYFTFKYPDSDDITPEQIQHFEERISEFEQSLVNGTYENYIDIDSFTSWLLAHDILGTWDSGGSNIYLTLYDLSAEAKLTMANLWDFDSIMKQEAEFARIHTDPFFYYPTLFDYSDFSSAYHEKWISVHKMVFQTIKDYINEFAVSEAGNALAASHPYDKQRWGSAGKNVTTAAHDAIDWFERREVWLTDTLSNMGIVSIPNIEEVHAPIANTYDLFGRKVSTKSNGLLIRNGKLVFVGYHR